MSDSSPVATKPAEPPPPAPKPDRGLQSWLPTVVDTVLAVVLALVAGALLIMFSTPRVVESLGYIFSYPGDFFSFSAEAVGEGYRALFDGSVGSGSALRLTLQRAAPLIAAGLGVAVAFRAGLFNIGAQGQVLVAALLGGYIGFHFDIGGPLHWIFALAVAMAAGAAYGGIAGVLKANTGAHEVITTIMLNNIAKFVLLYALGKEAFQIAGSDNKQSPKPHESAWYPELFGLHFGIFLAVLAAVGVWYLLERSTLGFEMRAVGANPDAARTAGMSVPKTYITVMLIAGALSGLAAMNTVLGQHNSVTVDVAGSVGFDAITVALLGRATPLGTVLAGLLFGALSAGGLAMQGQAGIPPELAQVLQALIVLFVAAPALVRGIFRLRTRGKASTVMASGW